MGEMMKASEVVLILSRLMHEHGDCEVNVEYRSGHAGNPIADLSAQLVDHGSKKVFIANSLSHND